MRFRPMKNKMNGAKPIVNFMPNNHGIPRRPMMPDQDFSTPRIPDLKAGGSGTAVPSNRKTIPDFRNGNRRDSMSSMSTGYFSMPSPNSRRPSEVSQTSNP